MDMPPGRPRVRRGTPPTPEDPAPSNQVVREYPNGISVITTGRPTRKILLEYEEAIAEHPESARLHEHYAASLKGAGQSVRATQEYRTATRLDPDSWFAHAQLAHCLKDTGDLEGAEQELRTALGIALRGDSTDPGQGETITRWSLAEVLKQQGRIAEARGELETAVSVQRELLSRRAGSSQLLRQLEAALRGTT